MSGFGIRFLCILLLLFLGCFRKIEQADFSDFTAKVELLQRGAKIHFPDHNRKQVQRISVFNVANNQILAEAVEHTINLFSREYNQVGDAIS